MASEIDGVKLQLAMAFGQGAGAMLASADALENLLRDQGVILDRARINWDASRWAFTELVRVLGQISAARAAAAGRARIEWSDIEPSVQGVMVLCPCTALLQGKSAVQG